MVLLEATMATMMTTGGLQYTFSPKAVSALADHDASTGEAVTCVYGVTDTKIRISESVVTFLTRLKIAANFAQFTRPNGSPVWINGSSVATIRSPVQGEYIPGVNTVISAAGLTQGVKEAPAAVTAALNAHGGDF
jgi:hypothetical protein